ncbi:hypothetical protein JHD48_09790 [Sulfurimonas sp. SAG-AH-194-I05]|nr:hypothetical protein [Sulfurimonas sp. SAG-AH-194-I05]MDF1876027.1 hypothetical protein [Sulfurimonas sp. SAG-AH-194-I05]
MKNLLLSLLVMFGATASVSAADVSAYLRGAHMSASKARTALKSAGYEVLVTYDTIKDGKTIVFTNDTLKAEAAKEKRAHAAILRLFVDDQDKSINITNPLYFGKAFMQDDYNKEIYTKELAKLNAAFYGLSDSKDKLDADDISGFHFMMGMPYYEDPDELATGSNSELLAKLKGYKDGKSILFELKLSDKSTLIGYDLSKRTKKFIKKIGRANAAVLPYCISIENGKATSLAPKYYLAISYPQLTMGEFMNISTVPGAIVKDLEKPFK